MLVLRSKYNVLIDNNERLFEENIELHQKIRTLERNVEDYRGQRNDLMADKDEIIDAKTELEEAYDELQEQCKKLNRNNKENIKANKKLRKQLESSTLDGIDIPSKLKLSKSELMTLEEAYEPNVQGFYVNFVDRLANQLQKNFPDLDINKFKEDCYSE